MSGTATVVDTAVPVHHTATVDKAWDGGANEKRLPSPMTLAAAKAAYGWYDAAQVDAGELPKAAAKLPHHEVDADGKPGAANLAGVRNALSRLPQSDIPAGEQAAVEKHLQAHLDDGDTADDRSPGRPSARRRLHVPAALRDLTRPGASFKHEPPAARAAADRWRVVNHVDEGPVEVWLYDEIGFWGVSSEMFCRALAEIDAAEILLRVNSPGGDVFDGTAMYNALVDHPAYVTCRVEGLAASAASFIAQAADRVVMGRGAELMIHDASGFCIGNAADMGEMAAILDRVSDGIAGIYHDRAGGSAKSWRDTMRGEQWYTADEAVTAGLADEVMAAPKKRGAEPAAAHVDARPAAGWDLSVFRYQGREAAPGPAAVAVAEPAPVRQRIVASAAPVPVLAPADPPEAHVAEEDPEPASVEQASEPAPDPAPAASPAVAADAPGPSGVTDLPGGPGNHPEHEPETAAEIAVEPASAPVAATGQAFPGGRAEPAPQPEPAPATPDPWAALTQHLTNPRPATVDQLLAALRGTP